MNHSTTDRTREEEGESCSHSDPPLRPDVVRLELTLRNSSRRTHPEIEGPADDSPDPLVLLRQIAKRWAHDWRILNPRLNRAVKRDAALNGKRPRDPKCLAYERGLRKALFEAESRGVTETLDEPGADHTRWLFDLPQERLDWFLADIELHDEDNSIDHDTMDPSRPGGIYDYASSLKTLVSILKGDEPEYLSRLGIYLRTHIFIHWVKRRATKFAEKELLRILFNNTEDFSPLTTLSNRIHWQLDDRTTELLREIHWQEGTYDYYIHDKHARSK